MPGLGLSDQPEFPAEYLYDVPDGRVPFELWWIITQSTSRDGGS